MIPTYGVLLLTAGSGGIDPFYAFVPNFVFIGATVSGSFVGFKSYLLDVAPADRRLTYLGITNSMMGIASMFPAVGGLLVEFVGHVSVFAMATMGWALILTRGLIVR